MRWCFVKPPQPNTIQVFVLTQSLKVITATNSTEKLKYFTLGARFRIRKFDRLQEVWRRIDGRDPTLELHVIFL